MDTAYQKLIDADIIFVFTLIFVEWFSLIMTIETDVIIVGAGPIGMVSAMTLADAGVNCIVVERQLERSDAPKAHAINARSLEICQRLGISADNIRHQGIPASEGGLVRFVENLTGTEFGHLPYERQDPAVKEFTPYPLINIAQPKLELIFSQAMRRRERISLMRGAICQEISQDQTRVRAQIELKGSKHRLQLKAKYLLAADGAASPCRDQLGITMEGPEVLQHQMMIHFDADLTLLTHAKPSLLYFALQPENGGVFIAHDRRNSWVFMHSCEPSASSKADYTEEYCRLLIQQAVGARVDNIQIKNISPWTMSAQVANAYQKGRAFLVGDAAHRFPPTGGLGLNTGIGEAQNIGWKMAMVLNGQANTSLLNSYQTERRPVAQINSHQSLVNSAKLFELLGALYGDNPKQSAEHFTAVCQNLANYPEVAAAVEAQRPHFDSLNLQLGYQYGKSLDPDSINISHYQPRYHVGCYLPHSQLNGQAWLLEQLSNQQFSLITGPDVTGWQQCGLTLVSEDRDFQSNGQSWWQQADLAKNGALLIRPDGHIAGRWLSCPQDIQQQLKAIFNDLLGRDYGSRN